MIRSARVLALAGLSYWLCSCAYKPLTVSSIGFKISGSAKSESVGAGESNIFVGGWLLRSPEVRQKDVFVAATIVRENSTEVVVIMPVAAGGYYGMYLPPAEYRFTAYIDQNEDGLLENQEAYGRREGSLLVKADGPSVLFDVDIDIHAEALANDRTLPEELSVSDFPQPSVKVGENLFADRYADEVGTLGLIDPNAFLQKIQLVQFIEEPDFTDERIPVVFVHGIEGTPRVFEKLEETLDHDRFQPWYFYYPTGARLPSSAAVLQRYFFSGQLLPKMPVGALTAYSMGGLVARGALNAYKGAIDPTPLPFYSSFVTPYGGVEEANIGIRSSPFRVPSWVDVASGSDYLRGLFSGLPEGTKFYLIAGNSEGETDGTIRLSSQRYRPAVNEAKSDEVFPRSHVGILSSNDALQEYFKHLLALAADLRVQSPLGSLERVRRAKVFFDAVELSLSSENVGLRVSRITETCERLTITMGHRRVVVQLAVGRGIRAEVLAPQRRSFVSNWPELAEKEEAPPQMALPEETEAEPSEQGDSQGVTSTEASESVALVAGDLSRGEASDPKESDTFRPRPLVQEHADEVRRLQDFEFTRSLVFSLLERLGESPGDSVATDAPADPLPLSPHMKDSAPPPMHLFLGALGTLNLGEQYLSLRVPLELAMYFGSIGFGADLRLPLISPVIKTENADLYFLPFGIGVGPRVRFGAEDSPLVANLGFNLTTEFGSVSMSAPGSGRPLSNDDVIDQTIVGDMGLYGSAHLGFRLSRDLYLRIGADFGSLFRPLLIRVEDEELTLFRLGFLNVLSGLEVRFP